MENLNDLFKSLQSRYSVYVTHRRYYIDEPSPLTKKEAEREGLSYHFLEANGGLTEIDIYSGNKRIASGCSRCSSKDTYCKKTGREIALLRAVESMFKD